MAHTLWDGPSTWRAALGLFCTYLKTAGRAHDNLRQMRTLEHYGPAPDSAVFDHPVEHSMEMYGKLISASHQEAPDIDLVVLDLPGTPARRLAHVAIHWLVPKVRWGAHMQALDTRVQNVPTAEQYWLLLRRTSLDNCVDVASMIDAEARATLLMAFCASPGREVLTARAVGFAAPGGHRQGCTGRQHDVGIRGDPARPLAFPRLPALLLADGRSRSHRTRI